MRVSGQIVDVRNRRIFKGEIQVSGNRIVSIIEKESVDDQFILPGFIDAHVHVESSMLVPSEFARLAVVRNCIYSVRSP